MCWKNSMLSANLYQYLFCIWSKDVLKMCNVKARLHHTIAYLYLIEDFALKLTLGLVYQLYFLVLFQLFLPFLGN